MSGAGTFGLRAILLRDYLLTPVLAEQLPCPEKSLKD